MSYNSTQSEAVPMHRVTAENSTGRLIDALNMGEISKARFIALVSQRGLNVQRALFAAQDIGDKYDCAALQQELDEVHSILEGVR